jgi:predicted nucleic acid-binding protein
VIYADASVLVSLYVSDANSARAEKWWQGRTSPVVVTALHRLEIRNAFSLAVFQNRIILAESHAAWDQFCQHVQGKAFAEVRHDWSEAFTQAIIYAQQQTPIIGGRSLDVLHVASAVELHVEEFLTFDLRQQKIAAKAGLKLSDF